MLCWNSYFTIGFDTCTLEDVSFSSHSSGQSFMKAYIGNARYIQHTRNQFVLSSIYHDKSSKYCQYLFIKITQELTLLSHLISILCSLRYSVYCLYISVISINDLNQYNFLLSINSNISFHITISQDKHKTKLLLYKTFFHSTTIQDWKNQESE